ncbi:MAG: hypothetical protein DRJ42_30680 [Deltaproteobacteria bacterium]|nr:MAG: hypothetical protein DRJ42_30680 [Deltaproteobacteria bacterium]
MTRPAFTTLISSLLLASVLLFGIGCAAPVAPSDPEAGTSALASVPYFDVFEGADGKTYFNLKAANHEIILSSQGYSSRTGALGGVLSVLDNGELSHRYELAQAVNGEYFFRLEAANGRVIGMSETYTTASSARRGIAGVTRNIGAYLDWQSLRTGARFDVFAGADERFYFNLHAANGQIVLSSQGYSSEAAAYNGAFSVADNGLDQESYDVQEAHGGGFYFNLKARNGRVIGTSEVYSSRGNAERACDSVIELLGGLDIL